MRRTQVYDPIAGVWADAVAPDDDPLPRERVTAENLPLFGVMTGAGERSLLVGIRRTALILHERSLADLEDAARRLAEAWAEPGHIPGFGAAYQASLPTPHIVELEHNPAFRVATGLDLIISQQPFWPAGLSTELPGRYFIAVRPPRTT